MSDSKRLEEIDAAVARFLRRDVAKESQAAMAQAVEEFNAWVHDSNKSAEAAGAELDREKKKLDESRAAISRLDAQLAARPDLTKPAEVDDFNRRVAERNALADAHGKAVDAFNASARLFTASQQSTAEEGRRRHGVMDEALSRHEAGYQAYAHWREQDGPNRLWSELNEVFARLRSKGAESPELSQARALREEIAQFASAEHERTYSGFLTVRATLSGEPVWLDLDTGATVVTVSPELVEALSWTGLLGEKVELRLAGGLRLSAPQLVIPEMTVLGQTADQVKGVVVKEPGFGRDGSLGLSYLTRFQYAITGGDGPSALALRHKSAAPSEYGVFICHKSQDEEPARILFDYLRAEGCRPFFSPVSLGVKSSFPFQQGIDRALEAAPHMVVVGSSSANMEAPWVRSEWQRYLAMRHMGRKDGCLLVLLAGGMQPSQLPVGLVDCQAISMQSADWREAVRRHLTP